MRIDRRLNRQGFFRWPCGLAYQTLWLIKKLIKSGPVSTRLMPWVLALLKSSILLFLLAAHPLALAQQPLSSAQQPLFSAQQSGEERTPSSNQAPAAASESQQSGESKTDLIPLKGIPGLPAFTVTTNPDGSQDYTVTLQILAIMTALTFIPALLIMMTSFTRIIIVFAILRQALGLQQSPSNQILIGLSLFLTFFIMSPVFEKVNRQALQPYLNETITARDAVARAATPFHTFMLHQTRESDIGLFMRIGRIEKVDTPQDLPFTVLVPAFITSELKTAFQIGFILFIPFLVIDIVVASVLMAMGMMMLSPLIISLPFKIMLFVLVDGWAMIIGTLAATFGVD